MKSILILTTALCLTLGCKKKRLIKSTIILNDIAYQNTSYSQVGSMESKVGVDFIFALKFYTNALPLHGTYLIDNYQYKVNPNACELKVSYNAANYISDSNQHSMIIANSRNGKGVYSLPKTWIKNETNPDDSITIEGTIYEPQLD